MQWFDHLSKSVEKLLWSGPGVEARTIFLPHRDPVHSVKGEERVMFGESAPENIKVAFC